MKNSKKKHKIQGNPNFEIISADFKNYLHIDRENPIIRPFTEFF